MGWRYLATRLYGDGTEELLHPDLPLSDVSLTNVLSGTGELSGSIAPADVSLLELPPDGMPLLQKWSTALYAEEDDVIRGGGILSAKGVSGSKLSLSALGFLAALKGQPYQGSKFFVQEDALNIARHCIDHWQSMPGGNLGLVLDRTTMSGTKIGTKLDQVQFDTENGPVSFEAGPYKLADYMTNDLLGAVESLASDYHFDYRETHGWSGESIVHRVDFGAPRIGSRRSDISLAVGVNVIVEPSMDEGLDDYASAVLVRGAGDGPAMKRAFIPRAGERRLRRVQIVEDKTLKSDTAVAQRGNSLLPFLIGATDITEISVIDHENAPLGSWVEGDEIELYDNNEWLGETETWVRILSTTINPQDMSVAKIAVIRADKIPT